ncbi:putative major capsid protein and peptidase U35 [Pseudomonas phage PPpW-3]|uniref:Putative major capsid protein and peptidase U35 n=1 Tax=Pseudomonas phage PPpW-3 TaxID=1279082 RepID=V5YSS9_9CAUD|nr:major head protein [Pseudomonas phage PPpW-3]BAO20605.1 putative major capsid protein and peptidase U35 [Pseudomonas phage PPpW-3]
MKTHKRALALALAAAMAGTYMTREGDKPLPDFNKGSGLQRTMEVVSHDVEARTVELAFSSEYEGMRWFGIEILDHSPASVRMERIQDSGALLMDHDWSDQVGVVLSASIDADRRGRAVVKFSQSARAQEIFQDIIDGIRKHISVGYRVHGAKLVETRDDVDVYRITDWEPLEISIVSVPFDHTVGFGRSAANPQEEPAAAPGQTATIQSGAATGQTNPEGIRNMNIKVLRDASGNLVRAEVDENDNIVKVLEVLEKAGEGERSAQQRGLQAEQARVRAITELGTQYNARDLALAAIGDTAVTAEAFQRQLLDHINTRGAQPQQRSRAGENAARNGTAQRGSTPISEMESPEIGMSDEEVRNYSFFRAIRALQPNASQRDKDAAAFELECSEAAQRQLGRTAQGILVPQDVLNHRAFNAGGAANTPAGAQTGNNLVATDFMAGSFIEMLRNRTTIMRLGTTMGGLVGNVDIPKQTGGATAYWLGEGDDAQEGTPTIGNLELSPKTVAAYTDITRRLLMQSTPDAEGIVRRDLANAIAQQIDKAGYYGTGTANQPRGIKNYTGINAVDFAALWPSYAELVQMETEIAADNADVNQMAYVSNAKFRGHAKTTSKFAGGTDQGVIWEGGGTVNGYRSEITNQISDGDVFFGNFGDLIIGLWGGLDLTVDPYSLSKSGGLRVVVFQDVDFVLRRVESICWGNQSVNP